MASPQILLISNGYENGYFLEHCKDEILTFLRGRRRVLFIPHAWEERRHTEYFTLFQSAVEPWGLHPSCLSNTSPDGGIEKCEAIFVGGGNTFRLLASLYRLDVMRLLIKLVVQDGVPYIGVSAGAMLATPAILTTSSKPVAYPPSFRGLGAVPFLLVPHYPTTSYPHQQSDISSSSNTTDKDITEVISLPGVNSIVGLPDGCVLKYTDGNVIVQSSRENTVAFLFRKDVNKTTIQNNKVISFMEFQTEHIPDEVAGPCIL